MNTVLACLNLIVERGAHCEVDPEHARLALHAIETQSLMAGALRLVVGQRKQIVGTKGAGITEALDHAEKLLELHDTYVAKHSPKPADVVEAKKPLSDQDVADLV